MTVNQLIEELQTLKRHGFENSIVKAYNGDTQQIEEVTGMLYGGTDGIVELCTDED